MRHFSLVFLVLTATCLWALPPRVPGMVDPHHAPLSLPHSRRAPQAGLEAMPLNIAPRGLILLISFQDLPFDTPRDILDSLFNADSFVRQDSFTYNETLSSSLYPRRIML